MKKAIIIGILILAALLFSPDINATPKEAGSSAVLASGNNAPLSQLVQREKSFILKKKVISAVLSKYNSPILGSEDAFIKACRAYELDCYLLPAITGLESGYGRAIIPGSYNGFGWGNGRIMFKDWDDGILTVGKGLRQNYINRGAETVDQIGVIYAASPTWAQRVKAIMAQFEDEERKMNLYLEPYTVQL